MTTEKPPARSYTGWLPRVIVALPELIPVAFMGLLLPAMFLLVINRFYVTTAIVVGLVGAVVACGCYLRFGGLPERVSRGDVGWMGAAIVGILAWVGVNSFWSGQDIYATRDPATYALAGRYLVDHHSLLYSTQLGLFGGVNGLDATSAGVGYGPNQQLYLQGDHGLPALLAMAYKVGGEGAFFRVNIVLGGVCLLAVYALARRFVPAWLACVAPLALGLSIPMLYVARDTYSEPLDMIFLLGGALLFWSAIERDRIGLYAIAGLVLGASAVARIDSFPALLAVLLALVVLCAVAPVERRRRQLISVLALLIGGLVGVVLGYRDLTELSYGYYLSVTHTIHSLGLAAVVVVVLGVVVVALCWRTRILEVLSGERVMRRIGLGAVGLTGLVYLGFATWPLWSKSHDPNTPAYQTGYIAALQKAQHLTIDPTRTYREYALTWQGWNYGWPLVILAGLGYALLMWRLVTAKERKTLAFVFMALGMSLLYFFTPQIVPDQAWAMRRYLPVVIPGLLVAAVYAVWQLRRLPWRLGVPVMAGLGIVLVAVPAVITYPMYRVRSEYPVLTLVQRVCQVLPANAAVVLTDSDAQNGYTQTMRSWCGVPAVGLVGATAGQLAEVQSAIAKEGRQLWAFSLSPTGFPLASGTTATPVISIKAQRWPATLQKVPQTRNPFYQSVFLGPVAANGTVRTYSS